MVKKRETEKKKTEQHAEKGDYLSKIRDVFKTAKFNGRYWKTYFIDVFYYAVLGLLAIGILYLAFSSIKAAVATFGGMENLAASLAAVQSSENPEELGNLAPLFTQIIITLIGYALLFFLFFFLVSTGFKGWIWNMIFGQKMSARFYFKYLGFRITAWGAILIAIFLAFLSINVFAIFAVFLIGALLLLHLFAVSLIYFVKDRAVWKGIGKGFKKGIRVHLFLLPYLFILAVIIVRGLVNKILESLLFRVQLTYSSLIEIINILSSHLSEVIAYAVISTIIGLLFTAYIRIWYAEFVRRI